MAGGAVGTGLVGRAPDAYAFLAGTGARLWQTRELRYAPVHGNGGSPVLAHNKLVFSIDGADKQQVVALDASTGKVSWVTPRESVIAS